MGADRSMRDKTKGKLVHRPFDYFGWGALLLLAVISYAACPSTVVEGQATLQQVFYYGWVTAVSTGLGIVPFFFFPEPDRFWMGVSNAVACGMMLTACGSLFYEGATFDEFTGISTAYSLPNLSDNLCL